MKTIIIWYRNDLRIHDHPTLGQAIKDADCVIPIFILDDTFLFGDRSSANRNRFLLECLKDLKQSLIDRGSNLYIRRGRAEEQLQQLAEEVNATAVYYTAEYSPDAVKQSEVVAAHLAEHGIEIRAFDGQLIVDDLRGLRTKAGTIHKIFTPFWRNWQTIPRRDIADTPSKIASPSNITIGALPALKDIGKQTELSPNVATGGEAVARQKLEEFLQDAVHHYHKTNNDVAKNGTSRLSPYLHFGCLSAREIETMLPDSEGAQAWHRQLCWRDFYHYVLFYSPNNMNQEVQEKYRHLSWNNNKKLLQAWQDGRTGYPIVDAAMRQLKAEGWMHNRARLIVGSFLTKDLWIDWRLGERYFMTMLLDGDDANNNGNWQWIASVGVDPAPVFRRLYNPSSQQKNYDPNGAYVRQFVPELQNVPDKYLSEPWTMPDDVQRDAGCIIGEDYPRPVVDHKQARHAALDQFYSA